MSYIIDNTKEDYKNFPYTLNGEVFLKRDALGIHSATVEVVKSMKGKSDAELERMGWLEYKNIIDSIE